MEHRQLLYEFSRNIGVSLSVSQKIGDTGDTPQRICLLVGNSWDLFRAPITCSFQEATLETQLNIKRKNIWNLNLHHGKIQKHVWRTHSTWSFKRIGWHNRLNKITIRFWPDFCFTVPKFLQPSDKYITTSVATNKSQDSAFCRLKKATKSAQCTGIINFPFDGFFTMRDERSTPTPHVHSTD